MRVENLISLYTDYLMVNDSPCTATGFSAVWGHAISHDKITRLLASDVFNSKLLWHHAKPICHETRGGDSVLIIDDSVEAKPYTKCNSLIQWHFDHTQGRSIKGINFVTALYYSNEVSIPVGVEFVHKDLEVINKKGKKKLKSKISKNEMFRNLVNHGVFNTGADYVLSDTWFSSAENMRFIVKECRCNFVMAIKENRKVALSLKDKEEGLYVNIKLIKLEECALPVYFEQLDFPVLLTKQVFKDGDGVAGTLYLACSDLNLSYERVTTIYKKRWKVEQYHKSIKSNISFAKSPVKKAKNQQAHCTASILAFIKMERLKLRNNKNHFALRQIMKISATKAALKTYQQLWNPIAA